MCVCVCARTRVCVMCVHHMSYVHHTCHAHSVIRPWCSSMCSLFAVTRRPPCINCPHMASSEAGVAPHLERSLASHTQAHSHSACSAAWGRRRHVTVSLRVTGSQSVCVYIVYCIRYTVYSLRRHTVYTVCVYRVYCIYSLRRHMLMLGWRQNACCEVCC